MKTRVKTLATVTFIALLLMGINVGVKGTEINASNRENLESSLALESWMIDETIWNTTYSNIAAFAAETETDLELEDWMTNAEFWNTNFIAEQEVDPGLELENWMTNDKIWDMNSTEKESDLMIESWMLDDNFWK